MLDEYDTPMQEAYVDGYWDELAAFTRSLFNADFKTNPYLERAIMMGITRVSKESVFSDLNNLEVVTTTSDKYATAFGFTEDEVFRMLVQYGMAEEKERVKYWYDGFTFGEHRDIYNPWSILNFLNNRKFNTYWVNTSSNSLAGKLIRESSGDIKYTFEKLLRGESIICEIDEQIVYNLLSQNEDAIWSPLLASGYLKVQNYISYDEIDDTTDENPKYELTITNHEVKKMFETMVKGWFAEIKSDYNHFVKALLLNDLDAMNEYMNRVAEQIFSSFDTENRPSGKQPERFYHGFVLGLLVELQNQYYLTSNQESGFGRYDIMLEPRKKEVKDAYIIEFKVFQSKKEKNLEETVQAALTQIDEKHYAAALERKGITREHIHSYGFAFEGKKVLIGKSL